jgi:hypothetical protein
MTWALVIHPSIYRQISSGGRSSAAIIDAEPAAGLVVGYSRCALTALLYFFPQPFSTMLGLALVFGRSSITDPSSMASTHRYRKELRAKRGWRGSTSFADFFEASSPGYIRSR